MKFAFYYIVLILLVPKSGLTDPVKLFEEGLVQLWRNFGGENFCLRTTDREDQSMKILKREDGEIDLEIGINLDSLIRVSNNMGGLRNVLSLLTSGAGGSTILLIDFNIDGTWDARRGALIGTEIFIDGGWVQVDGLEYIRAPSPVAHEGGNKYLFNDIWKLRSN